MKKKRIKITATTKFMFHIVKAFKELTIMTFLFASTLKNAAT